MITKNGEPIVSLDHWRQVAGPKHSNQWKEGRSALETARCWLEAGGALPVEITQLLASHPVGGAVGVPLWVVSGAGAMFATQLVSELN